MATQKDVYLVIGGSGFVGRHIVQQLVARNDSVAVFDIVQRYHDTPFYSGDISDQDQVVLALRQSGATCIIHTASPIAGLNDPALYYKVNVDGTKAVIAAAVETGVRKLVYTSSAGVVFNGQDLIDVDERLPPPDVAMDAYNESKAKGEEAVISANGKGGLLTVALRPAGIFGPGDRQVMTGFYQVYERGQTHFQIGDNNNLFDWTYVGNVAHAHLLAADKLSTPPPARPLAELGVDASLDDPPPLTEAEQDLLHYPLPSISLTTGNYRVPTCEARPLGPYVEFPPNGEQIAAAFESNMPPSASRPVARTRFDPFSDFAISRAKVHYPDTNPLQVAGQVFFITNGEPCYFWDFARTIWSQLDKIMPEPRRARKNIVLPMAVGLIAATLGEWYGWLVGKEAALTRYKVTYSCVNRYHNIEKARRLLGYEPQVGVEEGVRRMIEWWHSEYVAGNHKIAH